MRLSQLFGKTLRQAPAEAETVGHQLVLRAALVQQLSAGVYSTLPLGWRVLRKIEQIIREEMDAAGGQELAMPAIQPLELWQASGRDRSMADVLFHVIDKRDRHFVLGPTHEETVVELFKRQVRSYRDLPAIVYQIQTKFRDEPRPRGGLVRLRQFTMKDAYSFDTDFGGLDVSYQKMFRAYSRIFERCGVPTVPVLADSGAIGGKDTHEFVYLAESGEDSALLCDRCGYAANAECADFQKVPVSADSEQPLPVEEIPTPGIYTIEALAGHLGIPQAKTCKAVFYSADGRPLFVAIRGDMEVNETKLRRAAGCVDLHYMTEAEVIEAGFVPGSASAVDLRDARIVADDLLPREVNLVAGANKPDTHLLNVNYGRDWQADVVADIALGRDGYLCAQCGAPLHLRRGIEMGQIFKLGTVYSEKLGATFLDGDGQLKPVVMGCYGIGTERLLAAVVEANHDEQGIIWPAELAPYQVHLVALGMDRADVAEAADRLYAELGAAGIVALYDDRQESPGVKFNDADLLGMPLRLTVSARTLAQDSVELKRRTEKQTRLVPLKETLAAVRDAASS